MATVLALAFDPFNQNLAHIVPGMAEDATQKSTVSNGSVYLATGPFSGGDGQLQHNICEGQVQTNANRVLNGSRDESQLVQLSLEPKPA